VVAVLVLGRQAERQPAVPASSPGVVPSPSLAPSPSASSSPVATWQARDGAAVAYDEARRQLVMFGGKIPNLASPPVGQIEPGTVGDETWTWDGERWTQQAPRATPPARENALVAYDAALAQVVLFGGGLGTTLQDEELRDTWTWDGRTWTERPSAAVPSRSAMPGQAGAVMAYDPASRTVLLYEVTAQTPALTTETWRWDGAGWTMLHPATAPAVLGAVVVPDGRGLLLVGRALSGQTETWAWDGTAWSRLAPATSPPFVTAAAYDEARGRVVAMVGSPDGGSWQTWSWDGAAWTVLHPTHAPSRAVVSSVYYDSRSNRVVAFQPGRPGGQNWSWDGTDWSPATGP
jgi:hypothetical protein